MRHDEFILSHVLILLSCQPVLCTTLFPGSTTVVNLKPETFEKTVVEDKVHWAVVLYADWCGHCQAFAPKWESLAYKYGKSTGKIIFGALNCADHVAFCDRLGVEAFPDLRVWHFPNNTASSEYAGYQIPVTPSESRVDAWLAKHLPELSPISKLPKVAGDYNDTVPAPIPAYHEELPSEVTVHHRFHDAEVALLYALRQGVFLNSEKIVKGETRSVLKSEVLSDLLAVLDALSCTLPSRRACDDLSSLSGRIRRSVSDSESGTLEYMEWSRILDEFRLDGLPPEAGTSPGTFLRLCRTYTCGMWALFHIISLSPVPAEANNASVWSTHFFNDPLFMIRTFVVRFFGCSECVAHFTSIFDGCLLERCQEISSTSLRQNFALWLLKVHNNVTLRVAVERNLTIPSKWPSEEICPRCWMKSTQTRDDVYNFLRSSYWHADWLPGGVSDDSQNMNTSPIFGFAFIIVMCSVAFVCAYTWNRGALKSAISKRAQLTARQPVGFQNSPFLEDDVELEIDETRLEEAHLRDHQQDLLHDKSL